MTQSKDFKNVDYHSIIATGKVKQALLRFSSMLGNEKKASPENNNDNSPAAGNQQPENEDSASCSVSSTSSAPFVSKARRRTQVLALFPIYLLQVCYGMNTGFPAILTPQLQEKCLITSFQAAWIVSLDNFATPIVCILSGFFQQKFGPKKVLFLAALPYTLAWLLAAAANSFNLVAFLYSSRVLVGVSHALITTTVYTVEVASKDMRGTYSLWESVLRCLGCLIVYSLGFAVRWHQIALFAWAVPLLAAAACLCAPESPVFLLGAGRAAEAERAMRGLYGPHYRVAEEAEIIRANLAELREKRRDSPVWRNVRRHPEIYKPFLIVLLLGVIQQFSGMSILRAYVVAIFDEVFHPSGNSTVQAGGGGDNNATLDDSCANGVTSREGYLSAILLAIVRLASSLLLSKLLTKYDRRSMYMCSIVSTALSLAGFATCVHLIELGLFASTMKWASLAMACLLVFAVQLGVQTLPNLLSGELFSADVRALCKGLTRSLTCVFLVTGLMMFPLLVDAAHLYGAFYLLSIAMALFIPVVYCILPETRDMGLEMVQQFFQKARTVFYVDLDSYDGCDKSTKTDE